MESFNQLKQPISMQEVRFHPVVRLLAKIISFVFHPLFIPVYIWWFLIYESAIFPALNSWEKMLLVIRFAVMYTLFPLVTVLLAKGLGFIQSIYLKTPKDRIIPYVACGLYYFWMWYVLRNQPDTPVQLIQLTLGIFIASSLGLMANSYLKVSMHAIAVGVMAAFMLLFAFSADTNMGFYLSVALLIAGVVCTARLINADHHPLEIYLGFFIGIAGLLLAYFIA